jgi:ferritin-like metal-binding protein YciE
MTPQSLQEQLTKYLTDAHCIEQQALAQMKAAPALAGDEGISSAFASHLRETEEHERRVRQCLAARDASPATLKDLVGTITGKGFVAFARSQPDTTGKLVAHAYSYEHMEQAAYELIARLAERAGETQTAQLARQIGAQEHDMGERLQELFDAAVAVSLRESGPEDLAEQLQKYLADAHALEAQALVLLAKGQKIAGSGSLAEAYEHHHEETEGHSRMLEERLRELGSKPSRLKDAALSLGALNWGAFFAAQPDTPAKLAAFAFAFEHLEIAAYELLARVARAAGDAETEALAARILGEERAAAERLRALFDDALDASLSAQGVAA